MSFPSRARVSSVSSSPGGPSVATAVSPAFVRTNSSSSSCKKPITLRRCSKESSSSSVNAYSLKKSSLRVQKSVLTDHKMKSARSSVSMSANCQSKISGSIMGDYPLALLFDRHTEHVGVQHAESPWLTHYKFQVLYQYTSRWHHCRLQS